jgi:Tol biopolymer transport system component
MVRPAASLNAPAPSVRTLYQAAQPIRTWGWSFDATHIYTLEGDGGVRSVNLATGEAARLAVTATSLAVSPSTDELAYVAPDQHLHIWSAAGGDIAVSQVGAVQAAPTWSGDGHRLAAVVDAGGRPALTIVDRSTLSRFVAPDVQVAADSPLSWSFDGANLAFLRDSGAGKPAEVWIYRALSADSPLLQRVDALQAASLAWASDGNTLYAAVSPTSADRRPLQRAPTRPLPGQSGGFSPLRNTQDRDDSPATPSFDRRVAFVRDAIGQLQLWLINNDGSGLTQLTFANYDPPDQLVTYGVASPQWAPGGPGG